MNLCLRLGLSWIGRRVFTPPEEPTAVTWQSVTANGADGTATSSQLTFTFDVDPGELSAENFTIGWATKGTMTGTGTTRVLPISNITADNNTSQTVTLASNSSGYTITPTSRSVTVYVEDIAATWQSLTANGTSGTETTTVLTANISEEIPGLTIDNIVVTGATKGSLGGTSTALTVGITDITVADGENVNLAFVDLPSGYTITPETRNVAVYVEAVLNPPIASGTFAPPAGNVDSAYFYGASALFTGGTPTSYALATGSLPAGMSFNTSTGVFSGTPTTEETETGLSVSATNAGGTDTTNTASIVIGAAVSDPYFKTWHDEIEKLPQDANGWSIVEPSATSRIVYLSPTGNDGTAQIYGSGDFPDFRSPSSVNAYADIETAYAQLRPGEDDFLCIEYGMQIDRGATLLLTHGKSYANRQVICGYGNAANGRWIMNALVPFASTNQTSLLRAARPPGGTDIGNYIAIFDGHLTSHNRNPNHEDFGGWRHLKPGWGIDALATFSNTGKQKGMHFENCVFDWLQGALDTRNVEHFVERRNTYAWLFGGFSIGSSGQKEKSIIEECVYYKCGFYDQYNGAVFWHRPTAGQFVGQTSAALTGASETQVVFTQTIPANTPKGTLLYVTADNATVIECEVVSVSGSTATIVAQDFSANNAASGNTARLELFGGKITNHSMYFNAPVKTIVRNSVSIGPSSLHIKHIQDVNNSIESLNNSRYGNVLIDGEIGIEVSGNISSSSSPRFGNFDISGNTITNINETKSTNRNLAWGVLLRDHDGLTCNDNYIVKNGDASNTIALSIQLSNFANNCEISSNTIDDFPGVDLNLQPSQSGIVVENNRENESGYVDASRDIHSYMTSISEAGGIAGFAELLYGRSPQNWVQLDRDYAAYIKAGFTKTASNEIAFSGLTANGTSGTTDTDTLTLTFDEDPTGLAASDVTVTGATKGALSGTGTTRTLAISSITVANGETVNVAIASNNGNTFNPTNRDVTVYK